MAISRVKTWQAAEVLTAADLNAEFNNILNAGATLITPLTAAWDMDGQTLVMDADADTSINANTDDQLDFTVNGAVVARMTAASFTLPSGNTFIQAKGSDIASAASIAPTGFHDVTGTVDISSLGTLAAGALVTLRFTGAGLNVIYNATSLIFPEAKHYRTTQNEILCFRSLGSGNWTFESSSLRGGPTGSLLFHLGASAPAGYLIANETERSCTTYAGLFQWVVDNVADWGRGTATTTISSVDTGTEVITFAGAHGLAVHDIVHFANSGGALPTGLSTETLYYCLSIPSSTTATFGTTRGGSAVNLTGAGSGTNSLYKSFVCDFRGYQPMPADNGGGTPANRVTTTAADNLGQTGGGEDAINVTHNHGVTDSGHSHSNGRSDGGGAPGDRFMTDAATTTSTGAGATNNLDVGGMQTVFTGISINNAGSSGTQQNLPPYRTVLACVRY